MSKRRPEAVEHIEKIVYDILDKSIENQITINRYTARSLRNARIVRDTVKVSRSVNMNEKFTMVAISSFDPSKLKINLARIFALDIISNLKMNNPLWYCEGYKKAQHRKALEELEELQVLKRLRGNGMCFVFPDKMRRGCLLDIIGAFQYHLNKRRKKLSQVEPTDIIDLNDPPNDYELSDYRIRALYS